VSAVLSVVVPGVPVPQGSLRSLGRGRPTVHGNAEVLLPWRAAVVATVRAAMDDAGGEWPLTGPVKLSLSFRLPRPRSAPRSRLWPDRKPDLDKLVRAIGDSLTQSGAIADDAQIVLLIADKSYGTPEVAIELWPVGRLELVR
jgi:crossover junction endodeoxyribonuclease RusA